MSGDNSVAKEASGAEGQDGGVPIVNKGPSVETEQNNDGWLCNLCKQSWGSSQPKPDMSCCSFCNSWVCKSSSKTTRKSDYLCLARDDVFWACDDCVVIARELISKGSKPDNNTEVLLKLDSLKMDLESKVESIKADFENKEKNVLDEEIPKALEKCMTQVHKDVSMSVENMSRAWSDVVAEGSRDAKKIQAKWEWGINL